MSKKEKAVWMFLLVMQFGLTGWVWIEPRMNEFVRAACLLGLAIMTYLWNHRRLTA